MSGNVNKLSGAAGDTRRAATAARYSSRVFNDLHALTGYFDLPVVAKFELRRAEAFSFRERSDPRS